MASAQGDVVTLLLSDATKVSLRKDEIESQFSSLISVMPEKLLDELTLPEIADLFAFMETDSEKLPPMPKNAVTSLSADGKNGAEKIAEPARVK